MDGRAGMSWTAFSTSCLFCPGCHSKSHHKREENDLKKVEQVVSSSQGVLQPLFGPEGWRGEPTLALLAKGLAGCLPSLFPSGHAEVLPGL